MRKLQRYYFKQAIVLVTVLVGVRNEPQGQAYLPPSGSRPTTGIETGHPDEWAGDPANYEFSYKVQDTAIGLNFGHHGMRKDTETTGTYYVLLPDGRTQIVDYVADEAGYRPMIRYEGTATYPALDLSNLNARDEGYRY